jgi:hypothetical protein
MGVIGPLRYNTTTFHLWFLTSKVKQFHNTPMAAQGREEV